MIGKNTIDAIRSGVVFGYAGAVDAILRRLYDELGERADVIATGGLARLVVPYTEEIEEVDDLLDAHRAAAAARAQLAPARGLPLLAHWFPSARARHAPARPGRPRVPRTAHSRTPHPRLAHLRAQRGECPPGSR